MNSLTSKQLRRAARLTDKIEDLNKELHRLLGGGSKQPSGVKRKMSADGRARISAAAKARWARHKAMRK